MIHTDTMLKTLGFRRAGQEERIYVAQSDIAQSLEFRGKGERPRPIVNID